MENNKENSEFYAAKCPECEELVFPTISEGHKEGYQVEVLLDYQCIMCGEDWHSSDMVDI